MTRGRVRDKTYTGYNGVATDKLKAISKLRGGGAGGFGRLAGPSQESIRKFIESQICPWCGAGPYKLLATHTRKGHGVDAAELRRLAGYLKNTPTCSPELSARQSDRLKGQPLPVHASKAPRKKREYSDAGLRIQREKLDKVRTPELCAQAGAAQAAKVMAENADKYRQIIELHDRGDLFLKEIATTVGVSEPMVRRALKRSGRVENLRKRRMSIKPELYTALRAAGAQAQREQAEVTRRERIARFAELGSDWSAVRRLAGEWSVSVKSAAHYLRKNGADVPDGRPSATRRGPRPEMQKPKRQCSADTCMDHATRRGMCNRHYRQMMRTDARKL